MNAETSSTSQEETSSALGQLTIREYALESIQKNFHKSIKHESEVLADRDPEALHQMRVGMRRLRTALAVFTPFVSLPAHLIRDITKISKALGSVRDLDILGIWLSDYQKAVTPTIAEEEQLSTLLQRLAQKRTKQVKRMGKTLRGRRYRRFANGLQQWLGRPVLLSGAEWPIQLVLPDLLLPLINQLLLHPGWLAATSGSLAIWSPNEEMDGDSVNLCLAEYGFLLHDLRKQTKRVRYQTEFFTAFYGADYRTQTLEFRNIQDLLGQLQDTQVLSDFLDQEIGRAWSILMPSLALYFHEQRLALWLQWQTLQQKYLKADVRFHMRALVENPSSVRQ
jgi:CHAD domain-containing protein